MADIVSREQLIAFIKGVPSGAKASVKEGFVQIRQLPEGKYDALISAGHESLKGVPVAIDGVAEKLGVQRRLADLMLSAASIAVYACARYSEDLTAEEFVAVLREAGALGEKVAAEDDGQLCAFLRKLLALQSQFRVDLERNSELRSVMPNLTRFELNVDVRVVFDRNEVKSFMPVVVGHVDTDAEGQLAWFQLTKEQLSRLHEEVGDAIEQIQAVEAKLAALDK